LYDDEASILAEAAPVVAEHALMNLRRDFWSNA